MWQVGYCFCMRIRWVNTESHTLSLACLVVGVPDLRLVVILAGFRHVHGGAGLKVACQQRIVRSDCVLRCSYAVLMTCLLADTCLHGL